MLPGNAYNCSADGIDLGRCAAQDILKHVGTVRGCFTGYLLGRGSLVDFGHAATCTAAWSSATISADGRTLPKLTAR